MHRAQSTPHSQQDSQNTQSEEVTRIEILVAEDDDGLRESLMALFERLDFKVIGAATGNEFFEWLEPKILGDAGHWSPDAIITDVNMPGIPPLEVVEGLRSVGRLVPVVVISGLGDDEVRRAVEENGMPWLDKPLDPFVLEDTVRRVLAERFRRITIEGE